MRMPTFVFHAFEAWDRRDGEGRLWAFRLRAQMFFLAGRETMQGRF